MYMYFIEPSLIQYAPTFHARAGPPVARLSFHSGPQAVLFGGPLAVKCYCYFFLNDSNKQIIVLFFIRNNCIKSRVARYQQTCLNQQKPTNKSGISRAVDAQLLYFT